MHCAEGVGPLSTLETVLYGAFMGNEARVLTVVSVRTPWVQQRERRTRETQKSLHGPWS